MLVSLLLAIVLQAPAPPPAPAYVPERVYDTGRDEFADFEVMLAAFARADVVLVGEHHDNSNTHRLEAAMLEGLGRRQAAVTVSLEMFERDVQLVLDRYLSGEMDEAQFLQEARPWPRYATDYRPLVETARTRGWRVLASNVPRRLAADVARSGRPALDRLSGAARSAVADELECPRDAYYHRVANAMRGHTSGGAAPPADAATRPVTPEAADTIERYYWSQCVKDETMAESIARVFDGPGRRAGPVVHFTGAFHTDFGGGTAARTRRRLPGRRVLTVSILPVEDMDVIRPAGDDLQRADFLVYTVK